MQAHYDALERDLLDLLVRLGDNKTLTTTELEEARHYIHFAEYGIAPETLCAVIQEEQRNISSEGYGSILELDERMELETELRELLKNPVFEED